LAQLGQPDMRTPIAYSLGFPERIDSGVGLMDLASLGRLDFDEPDLERFPCLKLSFDALHVGQAACIALNAANEVAVDQFLQGKIRYTEIAFMIRDCLDQTAGLNTGSLGTLEDILDLDNHVRRKAHDWCLLKQ